jgi:transcriptional regulator with XRE-family HTH domain
MWSLFITDFRSKHNMTQEQAALMLGVEPRTIRRWEAGFEPSSSVRQRLMPILVPHAAHRMANDMQSLLELSSEYIMILDEDFNIIANSKSHQRFMFETYKIQSIIGLCWMKWIPSAYRDWIEQSGKTTGLYKSGFVSRRTPYAAKANLNRGRGETCGINDHTLLRVDGSKIHLTVTKELPRNIVTALTENLTYV